MTRTIALLTLLSLGCTPFQIRSRCGDDVPPAHRSLAQVERVEQMCQWNASPVQLREWERR